MALRSAQPPSVLTLAAGAGLLLSNKALLRVGLRQREDGWRRATGLMLREEASTFVLSAFGLNAGANGAVEERLQTFLDDEPCCRASVVRGEMEDRVQREAVACYTLKFERWVDGPERFVSPRDWGEDARVAWAGGGKRPLMNIVCRLSASAGVDVWMRINHVGADGAPMQEMLTRLEAAWESAAEVVYPTPEEFAPHESSRELPGRAGWAEAQAFVDFGPLLAWRKRANAALSEPMTVSAAMLWCLGREGPLAEVCCGTTVEVSAAGGLERGVGVVVVRPMDYPADVHGLGRYVADFNRAMEETRRRESDGCRTLDAAARLPAGMAKALLGHALERTPRAFGRMALTVLKDARVFGAPLAETGHAHGFLAMGGIGLPAAGGRKVGCITVKGPEDVVKWYPGAIRAAMARCAAMPPRQ